MSKPNQYQMMPAIQVVHIKDIKAFEALRDAWNLLLQKNPHRDAFLTWEWLYAWWKHYGKQRELWLVTAWIADELVGLAPLMLEIRRKYGLRLRVLCSLGTPDNDVGGFVVRDGDPLFYMAICNYLINQKGRWDILELNEFLLDSSETRKLITFFTNAGFRYTQKNNRHFYLPIQGDWQNYNNHLPRKLRATIRQKTALFIARHGEPAFTHHTGHEVTWQDVSAIFEINEHGRFPFMYRSIEERAFQRELFKFMSVRGWLDIFLLYIKDQPVAYDYGFYYNHKYEDWRTGFNTNYSDLSVGIMIFFMEIEDCFKRAYSEIDFLRGDEYYKSRWQPQERTYTQMRFVAANRPLAIIAYIWLPKLKALIKRAIDRKI
jgi:CelD/BcsL family acetyltransferase involved in cellulose biosynthesis